MAWRLFSSVVERAIVVHDWASPILTAGEIRQLLPAQLYHEIMAKMIFSGVHSPCATNY